MSERELKTERLHLMVGPSEIEAIDEVRFGLRFGTRAKAIRYLLKRGIESLERKSSEVRT